MCVCVCVCVCARARACVHGVCAWCVCVRACIYIFSGILRNLAFEKTAYRKEIIAFGGVEALLKVHMPHCGLRPSFYSSSPPPLPSLCSPSW